MNSSEGRLARPSKTRGSVRARAASGHQSTASAFAQTLRLRVHIFAPRHVHSHRQSESSRDRDRDEVAVREASSTTTPRNRTCQAAHVTPVCWEDHIVAGRSGTLRPVDLITWASRRVSGVLIRSRRDGFTTAANWNHPPATQNSSPWQPSSPRANAARNCRIRSCERDHPGRYRYCDRSGRFWLGCLLAEP